MTKDLIQYANSTYKIHFVDGIGVQYCYPYAWNANLYVDGTIKDIVPVVTVTAEQRKIFEVDRVLGVRFKDTAEAIEVSKAGRPFYVAVAWNDAKPGQEKAVFGGFFAVYLVQSTGAIDVGFKEIDARILGKRVSALEFVAPQED
jgi:hypothetical protein